jgi:flagellar hook-associated protein 2
MASGAISSPGLGSGLEVSTIVPQLVALEHKPIDALNAQTATLQAQLSAFGLLQSYTANVHDAMAKISAPAFWQQTAATSTDASSVTVATSAAAGIGSYSIEVSQLAQAQSLASKSYAASTDSVGTGTLHIEFGAWNADKTSFTEASPPTQVDIPIAAGEDTLESVRTKINASNAGVSASIVKDNTGSRLVIRSTVTGEEHSLRITADADAPATPGGASLSDLVYDPATGPSLTTETAKAQNAKAKINGIDVVSSSNTFTDVSDGVSLTVSKLTAANSPVIVKVALDTATMKSALNDFVKAYNDISKYLATQTAYDADKKVGATLQGDRSTLSLQSQLRSMITSYNGGASNDFKHVSDAGIEVQADGTLKINDAKLSKAMDTNMSELSKAFTNVDTLNPSNNGFAARMTALTNSLTSIDGLVTTRSAGLQKSIDRNDKQAAVMEQRVDDYQTRLLKQYSDLDVKMSSLNTLSTYINQQVAQWNKA